MELGDTCDHPLFDKMEHYGYSLIETLLCLLRHCGYPPHKIYGDLPSHIGKGHRLILKFTRFLSKFPLLKSLH